MAAAPRSTAGRSLNPPPNFPMGVLAPATITDGVMTVSSRAVSRSVYGPGAPRPRPGIRAGPRVRRAGSHDQKGARMQNLGGSRPQSPGRLLGLVFFASLGLWVIVTIVAI